MTGPDWGWVALGVFAYGAFGLLFGCLRSWYRGNRGDPEDTVGNMMLMMFWPCWLPLMWCERLFSWLWAGAFDRNLPPANQHPTARPYKKFK